MPKFSRECLRGYTGKQTFILLKIHPEKVENNTFLAKCPILSLFIYFFMLKMPKVGVQKVVKT